MSKTQKHKYKRCHATHIDYVSKWVEALLCKHADNISSKRMFEEIRFPRFGVPRCGGINPYTLTARLGPGGLAHYETSSRLDPIA